MASPIEGQLHQAIIDLVDYEQKDRVDDYWSLTNRVHVAEFRGRALLGGNGTANEQITASSGCPSYGIDDPESSSPKGIWISLDKQVRVLSYKIDILLSCGQTFLGIECDGHEWHDTTKKQASADRARDRDLLRIGVRTIRFTGGDIFRDANACAVEALRLFSICVAQDELPLEAFNHGYDRGRALLLSELNPHLPEEH